MHPRPKLVLVLLAGLALSAAPAGPAAAQTPAALQLQLNKLATAQRTMDSTLKRLEARIAKLEMAAEQDDQDLSDEAEKAQSEKQASDLERRIAALERTPAAKSNPSSAGGSTVRAPFVVQDADGSVVFRVTGGKTPRLLVGVEKGGGVELGTGSAGGGILRVRDATSADRVILIGSEGFGQLRALSQTHSAVLSSNDETNGATLGLFVGDVPTARIRSGLDGHGSLVITNPAGEERVGLGSVGAGSCFPGSVRTGPKRRVGSAGLPSVLQGAC
jgi:hypothetical protein